MKTRYKYRLHADLDPADNARTPEQLLLAAVVDRAIRDLTLNTQNRIDAIRWFHGDSKDFVLSFDLICETLELDAHLIRKNLINGGVLPPKKDRWNKTDPNMFSKISGSHKLVLVKK